MPRQVKHHTEILEAIGRVPIISELVERGDAHGHGGDTDGENGNGHTSAHAEGAHGPESEGRGGEGGGGVANQTGPFKYELDLDVIAYGRNYNGKKVGPYVKLFIYEPGEEVIRQGDWGGNTFYVVVEGSLDVYVADDAGGTKKVGELPQGTSFGEMSILAGVPRNATCKVPDGRTATVLEITRPALRLLRKLHRFGSALDTTYRKHGLGRTLVDVQQAAGDRFDKDLLKQLGEAARFVVYGKGHVMHEEGDAVEKVVFLKNGWVRRVRGMKVLADAAEVVSAIEKSEGVDFLGAGNCLGLEGLGGGDANARWGYTATVLTRTEALEIDVDTLRNNPRLLAAVRDSFSAFSLADDDVKIDRREDLRALAAAEKEITTGLVDATNLLVMDMDLCVRCGNCSMACHKVHGRSRLLRRGIHVVRPTRLGSSSTQHVLAPSVCLHCQDPECLTGCPTGAIGRMSDGQIDIDTKTCIGCGDCAVQCPYSAISMIPRKAPAAVPQTWKDRARSWISLAPPTPPAEVTETEDLLAVKCNLCNNTPLNPKGAKRHAYSCEENCPTGALARVNPREYFDEVRGRVGLIFQDQTHAIGRNIHRRDPLYKLWNVGGIIVTLLLAAATVWGMMRYGLDGRLGGTWLTVRWLTGIVGLVGIAAVMSYSARKQVYRRRAGPLRYWLLLHVYAGVAAGILLLLHGGTSTGGLLTTALMLSFDLVILTGLFGTAAYIIAPRVMTSIEGEPLLVEDLRARRDELRTQLATIGQQSGPDLRDLVKREVRRRFLSFGFLLRQYLRRENLDDLLRHARKEVQGQADSLSDTDSRRLFDEAVEATVLLRRADSLIYLHQLLKLWLAPHVVATALMLVLMLVHIIQVVFFAVR
ncbi:MAG TPA: cyclic nucleotide-binding domain-containing protein [Pyrinomonadaceae bacterium]|nr:cyclic nucleotide-binding domain-containing protein [Pyrinomonadaceae bacterium]